MMIKDYSKYTAHDFLIDEDFILAYFMCEKERYYNEIIKQYPYLSSALEEAFTLIQRLKINKHQPPVSEIKLNTRLLELAINQKRKNLVHIRWISTWSAIAAIIIIAILFTRLNYISYIQKNKNDLYSTLVENNDSLFRSGKTKLFVNDLLSKTLEGNAKIDYSTKSKKIAKSQQKGIQPTLNRLIVPYGRYAQLTLCDKSKVWINSGTTIIYPTNFDEDKREIYVDGEIYIEVTPNAKCPFIIKTSDIDVKVLGTSFNLSAYKNDLEKNVVLLTGKVEISDNKKALITLAPNQQYCKVGDKITINKVISANYIIWKDGLLLLHDTNLSQILKKLSRHYNINIKYEQELILTCSGKLKLSDNIEDVISTISETAPIEYYRKDKEIIIKHKKKKIE